MRRDDVMSSFMSMMKSNEDLRSHIDIVALGQRDEEYPWKDFQEIYDSGIMSSVDLADAISLQSCLPRADPEYIRRQESPFAGLSVRYLREAWAWPYLTPEGAVIAIADPARSEEIEAVRIAVGADAPLMIAAFDELSACFERNWGAAATAATSPGMAEKVARRSGSKLEADWLQDIASGEPVVHAVDGLLEAAADLSATDIHIEPGEDEVRVRLRIDGLLRRHLTFPTDVARSMISRIKILAALDISETRLPQDGRARVRIGEKEADLRVATMPTLHGEAVVIRLLLKDARALDLSQLGMGQRDLDVLREQLEEPHGLIIVSGPTGSGKTTTLAAALSYLNRPERKIMTIEDPIEYQIPGLHQTQVKQSIGLTFETALRSFLRHDPNILMVGEMRNRETAAIGLQAALTGHLVLTTLHTNTAIDSVIRLSDLHVENFLLASALRCVVGQRLVRRLCDRCKQRTVDIPAAAAPLAARGLLDRMAGRDFCQPKGCDVCGRTGYRGRIGIFEVLRLDPASREEIRLGLDPRLIQSRAREGGMTTMVEDGVTKIYDGMTSFEEVLRETTIA